MSMIANVPNAVQHLNKTENILILFKYFPLAEIYFGDHEINPLELSR